MAVRRRIKAFLIAALAVLAVYQAGLLWFENINEGSFLPRNFFTPWRAPVITEDISDLARPFRIISGSIPDGFSIDYSNLETVAEPSRRMLSAVFANGEFVERAALGYADILTRPSYVYEYTFQIPAAAFAVAIEERAAFLTSNGLSATDTIVIQPPTAEDSFVHAYFASDGEFFHYRLKDADGSYSREIPGPRRDGPAYSLMGNGFAARWPNAVYRPVTVTNPYLHTYGDKLISNIKTCVEVFFENPALINETSGGADDVLMTFSDANTVVRYYQNDTLEYSNYRVAGRNTASTFAGDYAAAVTFVNTDSFIVNEFYLAGYTEAGGQRTFMFDFVINNYPLLPVSGGHAVEVTADRGTVVRYKKSAYNFHIISKEDLIISDSFDYPGGSDIVPVLGYPIIDGESETLALDFINRY